jgi:MFS family permease
MNKTLVKITLLFTSSLTIMAGATIAPSLPQIEHVFSYHPQSEILTKLILTMPALFIAFGAPPAGLLIDRYGRVKLLLGSLILYGLSGTSGFFVDDIYLLLAGRAILGIAVAGVLTTTITLIADYFSGEERNAFMGLQGACVALGGVLFITTGGLLAEVSWRAPFLIYLAPFVIFPVALYSLSEPRINRKETVDTPIREDNYQKYLVVVIYITALIGMMIFYIIPVQIPFYIKEQTGVSNTLIGLAIACSTLSSAVVSLNYKKIRAKWPFSFIYFFSFFFLSIGFMVIFFVESYIMIALGLLIGGIGMGVLIPNSNVWIVSLSPESMRGRIVGGLTTSVFIGQFVSPLITEPILVITSTHHVYVIAGISMFLISVAYLIYTLYLNRRQADVQSGFQS